MTEDIQKIREILKNINTDDEIDEIYEILDRLDGSFLLQDPKINASISTIVKHGHIGNIDIMHQADQYQAIGTGTQIQPSGVVRATVEIVAPADKVYDQ